MTTEPSPESRPRRRRGVTPDVQNPAPLVPRRGPAGFCPSDVTAVAPLRCLRAAARCRRLPREAPPQRPERHPGAARQQARDEDPRPDHGGGRRAEDEHECGVDLHAEARPGRGGGAGAPGQPPRRTQRPGEQVRGDGGRHRSWEHRADQGDPVRRTAPAVGPLARAGHATPTSPTPTAEAALARPPARACSSDSRPSARRDRHDQRDHRMASSAAGRCRGVLHDRSTAQPAHRLAAALDLRR